jgi:hypothetical protein
MQRRFAAAVLRRARLVAAVAMILGSAPTLAHTAAQRDDLVATWNAQLMQAVRDTGPSPTVTSRMLAVVHTCMYDAWAAYDDRALGTIYADRLRRPSRERTRANKRAAISHAALMAAIDLMPTQRPQFETFMHDIGFDPNDRSSTASWIGRKACDAVLKFRHADGSNQLGNIQAGAYSDYTGYQPRNTPEALNDPQHWQPLSVPNAAGTFVTQKFTTPQWGRVRPFAIDVRRIQVNPPAAYGSRDYLEQAREMVSYSGTLTDVQKCVAEYWADGPRSETPPGHWNLFAQLISARDAHGIDDDVKMFFAMNSALMDAGIEAWWIKRRFDYVRPVSAVRHLFGGKMIRAWPGPQGTSPLIRGEDWQPYQVVTFVTPPFPEYISGHSTFSAAAARILKLFTGSDVFGHSVRIEAGSMRIEPHVPAAAVDLSWATFTDAANEAGLSRRYGGIHFREGDLEGRRIGRDIGDAVWEKASRLFSPPRHRPWNDGYADDSSESNPQ